MFDENNNNKRLNLINSLNVHEKKLIGDAKYKKISEQLKLDKLKNIYGPDCSCNKIVNENNSVSIDMNKCKNVNSLILLNNKNPIMKINNKINHSEDHYCTNNKLNYFKLNICKYYFYHCFKKTENKKFELYENGIGMITNILDIINVFNTNYFFDDYFKKMNNTKRFI